MFESPVLRQIIPTVVLQFPPVMTQPANLGGGKNPGVECGDPKPFVRSFFGFPLALAVVCLSDRFLGANDSDQARVLSREG